MTLGHICQSCWLLHALWAATVSSSYCNTINQEALKPGQSCISLGTQQVKGQHILPCSQREGIVFWRNKKPPSEHHIHVLLTEMSCPCPFSLAWMKNLRCQHLNQKQSHQLSKHVGEILAYTLAEQIKQCGDTGLFLGGFLEHHLLWLSLKGLMKFREGETNHHSITHGFHKGTSQQIPSS